MNKTAMEAERKVRKKAREIYAQAGKAIAPGIENILRENEKTITAVSKGLQEGTTSKAAAKKKLAAVFRDNPKTSEITETIYRANEEARQAVNDSLAQVVSDTMNSESFKIEQELEAEAGLVPVSEEEAEEWIDDEPEEFGAGDVDQEADEEWNGQNLQHLLENGVFLGLSLTQLIRYINTNIEERNRQSFLQRIQDIISGAEELGRYLSSIWASWHGVKREKVWVATLDFKTRDAHRELDSQRVPENERFYAAGEYIRFPHDPQASGKMRCNCRCAMKWMRPHWEDNGPRRENIWNDEHVKPILPHMTYAEWYQMKIEQYGEEEIKRMVKEMKREQAAQARRRRERKEKEAGSK
jgi:hypothetical protein